jgi:hypothetical protein
MKGLHVVFDTTDYCTAGDFASPVSSHTVCNDIKTNLIVDIKGVLVILSFPSNIGMSS